ncbi:MAG: tetratricopeptide repeat protein [Chloroflexota bacterium]
MQDIYGRYAEALRLGHQSAAEGRFKDALSHYQAAAELAGERALPHVAIGGMFLRLGKVREALSAYERALTYDPEDMDAQTGRAAALLAAGRRSEAAEVHERITHGGPLAGAPAGDATQTPNSERLMLAGEEARASQRPSAAIDAWLAESAEHRAAEHYDAALDACLRALSLDSSAARSHLEFARVWLARGWKSLAAERVKLLERLLALQPDDQVSAALRDIAAQMSAAPASTAPPAPVAQA